MLRNISKQVVRPPSGMKGFPQGCRVQMGDVSKNNLALEIKLFKKVIDRIGLKVVTAIEISTRNKWYVT